MALDFTFTELKRLYETILANGFEIITFYSYLQGDYHDRAVILRHDVDRFISNALKMARFEQEMGIHASYYFRCREGTDNSAVIKEIAGCGHEAGYHYEVLAKTGGNMEKAFQLFQEELNYFRRHVDVKTICMHGSPLSRWDSRELWKTYNYKDLGLIGEPYFDLDFSRVGYLTDTGRRWNCNHYNIRDRVNRAFRSFKDTAEIRAAFQSEQLPGVMMINIHPHRWHENRILWFKEWLCQNVKNIIKYCLR